MTKTSYQFKNLSDILENQEIKGIITCLGCGVGENFNIDNMRYSKVIIATDADPDGGHIELLLMTLFLYHLPQLVEAGMIYTAVSPLYKIVNRQGTKYYYTEGDAKNKTGTVSRFKGLGELPPEELQLTVLNPDYRRLVQLKPLDLEEAKTLYTTLMGRHPDSLSPATISLEWPST